MTRERRRPAGSFLRGVSHRGAKPVAPPSIRRVNLSNILWGAAPDLSGPQPVLRSGTTAVLRRADHLARGLEETARHVLEGIHVDLCATADCEHLVRDTHELVADARRLRTAVSRREDREHLDWGEDRL